MSPRSRARSKVFALLGLLVPAAIVGPLASAGEPKAPRQGDQRERQYDPDNVTALSQYMETVVKGMALFESKDSTGAIDTLKKAVQLNPRHPLANLLLANVYVSIGNVSEADGVIQQAYEGDAKNALLRSHVLFVRADVFERQKKAEQAKAAWQEYTEHAAKLSDAGALPQAGAERVKALQRVIELEKAYAAVRERIAAEKAAASASASAAPKPPPKKK